MNKENYIQKWVDKGKDVDEVNKKWAEFELDAKEFGMKEEDAMKYCHNRLGSFYSKSARGKGVDFEAVIVGFQSTDYGKTKVFEEAKKADAEDHEAAVLAGLVNDDGEPLEKAGFNKGNPIDITKVWNKSCVGVARKEGSDKFERMTLGIGGDNFGKEVPLFSVVKFAATDKRNQDNNGWKCNAGVDFSGFEVVQDLNEAAVEALLSEHFSDDIKTFEGLEEYHEMKDPQDYNSLAILKGNVTQVMLTQGSKSNVLAINEIIGDEIPEDVKVLTCWVDKTMPLNVSEAAQNVWIIGRTNKNQSTGDMSLNLFG